MNKYLLWIFILCMACNSNNANNKPLTVATKKEIPIIILQPINNFSKSTLQFLKDSIEKFYPVKVEIGAVKQFPQNAYYKPRNRFRADSIISWLRQIKPQDARTIAALTNLDISTTKGNINDYGVMGLGYQPGVACVVSDFRLQKNNPSGQLLKERIIKTVVHELGHNFGLSHCANKNCIMANAEGKMNQDNEKDLCIECRKKLKI